MTDFRKAYYDFDKKHDLSKMSNSEIRRAFQALINDDDENELGHLAMSFRGCGNAKDVKEQRKVIVQKYADVVQRLIDGGVWDEIPAPEDMLPNEYMPEAFNKYWNEKWKTKY
jgi:hypothetical protein